MKKILMATMIAGSLCSVAAMADNLTVKLDNGVDFSQLQKKFDPNKQIDLDLTVHRMQSESAMMDSTTGTLHYLTNQAVLRRHVDDLSLFNYVGVGIPSYNLSLSVKDATTGQALYHCGRMLDNVKFVSSVNYVLHIHSLQDGDCTLETVE